MSATLIILAIVGVAFFGLLIFSRDFRRWLGDTLTAIGLLIADAIPTVGGWLRNIIRVIGGIIGIYSLFLICATLIALVLIIVALLFNSPGFTAFAFVWAISTFLLTWMPAGIVMKVFRVNKAVVPQQLRFIIAWVAFIGFLGMVHPDVLTWKSLLGFALFGFIWMATSAKFNAIDRLIFPLVIIMCLAAGWEHFFPDNYRATTRYAVSWGKRLDTMKDRGSINNETDATTTYAVVLRDVNTLYDFPAEGKPGTGIPESITKNLPKGTIVKISNHKQEVKEFDGQGFIRIQLANANGSFVLGKKHWIEAEYVQIATPREITPKDDSLLPSAKNQPKTPQPPSSGQTSMIGDSIFTKGVYDIDVNGKTPFVIRVAASKTGCEKYSMRVKQPRDRSDGYDVLYADGTPPVHDAPGISTVFPNKQVPRFQLAANIPTTVELTVN
jgi:hypothetical protein